MHNSNSMHYCLTQGSILVTHTAEIFGSSIVAVGAFNPAIFSSDWLERNGLIGIQDANVAHQNKSYIVSSQICAMETDWFALQVLENQFALTSKDALSPALKDLAVGVLSLLPQTPISAIGINFMGHYRMTSVDEYHKIGDVFAPKKIWNELFPDVNNSAGLDNLTIRIEPVPRGKIPETGDAKRVALQTSTRIKSGIYLSFNDHRVVHADEDGNLTMAEQAAKMVNDNWQSSWEDSIRVFDGLISNALAQPN